MIDIGLMRRTLETLRIREDWDGSQSADEIAVLIALEYERQKEYDALDAIRRKYATPKPRWLHI